MLNFCKEQILRVEKNCIFAAYLNISYYEIHKYY